MLDCTDQNCSIIEELALQRCCGQKVSGTDLLQGDQDRVRVNALLRFCFFVFSHPRVRLCAFPNLWLMVYWTSPDRFTLRSIQFLLRAGILRKEEQNVLHNTVGIDHWEKVERRTDDTVY